MRTVATSSGVRVSTGASTQSGTVLRSGGNSPRVGVVIIPRSRNSVGSLRTRRLVRRPHATLCRTGWVTRQDRDV